MAVHIPKIDAEKIAQEIRSKLSHQQRPSAGPPINPIEPLNWRSVEDALAKTEKMCHVWTTTPDMEHYNGVVKAAARIVGKVWLYFSQVVTKPQEEFNVSITSAYNTLRDVLHTLDRNLNAVHAGLEKLSSVEGRLVALDGTLTSAIQAVSTRGDTIDAGLKKIQSEVASNVVPAISTHHEQLLQHSQEISAQGDTITSYRRELGGLTARLNEQVSAQERDVAELRDRTASLGNLEETVSTIQNRLEQLRGLEHLVNELKSRAEGLTAVEQKVQEVQTRISNLETIRQSIERQQLQFDLLQKIEPRVADTQDKLASLLTRIVGQERRIATVLEEARKRLPEPFDEEQLDRLSDELTAMDDSLYLAFEDQFRGTRGDIKDRLRIYLPILKDAQAGSAKAPVLDVGCGRGEWLELLKENGMSAEGVDTNSTMVEQCNAQGLRVVRGDALQYLQQLDANSLGAVTGFHIIEHLPFMAWVRLFDEALRTLKPGGVLIFETPNPENILVGSNTFYYDPTHRNPLPLHLVKFIAEARGFSNVDVLRLHPYPESAKFVGGEPMAAGLNALLYGPQDYAIVARKVNG